MTLTLITTSDFSYDAGIHHAGVLTSTFPNKTKIPAKAISYVILLLQTENRETGRRAGRTDRMDR